MLMEKELIGIILRFMLCSNFRFIYLSYFFFRKKEGLEREITILEKDIEKLNSNNVLIDLMR